MIEEHIPQWGGWIKFRALSGEVALEFQKLVADPAQRDEAWIRIVGLCAVRHDNVDERLFTDAQVELLKKKSASVFVRLQERLSKLNGLTKEAIEEAKKS